MRRLRRWLAGWGTAMLAGALFTLSLGRMQPEGQDGLALLVIGAVYGLAVLGLIRLFGTRRFGYVVAGLLSGPAPAALLLSGGASAGDRAGFIVLGMLLGLLVALLEWARPKAPSDRADQGPPPA